MLFLIPKDVPAFELMLADIGRPDAHALARALGVTERTVKRWLARGQAPRAAMLAIYWITQWGQNQVHTKAHNDAVLFASYVRALKDRVDQLEAQVTQLGRIGDFGTANDPAPNVVPVPPGARARPTPVQQARQPRGKPRSTSEAKPSSTKQPRALQRG